MSFASQPSSTWQRLDKIASYWAQKRPDAVALIESNRQLSWQAMNEAIDKTVDCLQRLGIRGGDRVMVVGENSMAQVLLIFALSRLNAWSVNVNARLSVGEIETIASHSGARRCLYLSAVSGEAAAHAKRHGAIEKLFPTVGLIAVGALNTACTPEPVVAEPDKQVATLIYTTGTTGHPKGVMLTHRNLLFIAQMPSQKLGHLTMNDRVYGVLPITHVYGLASMMLGTLFAGATLQLVPRYRPQALLKALQHDGITVFQGVPAMYARLLEFLGTKGLSAEPLALRFMYAGGSPLDAALKQRVERLFSQPLHNGYGLTECSPTISQTRIQAPRQDTSVGQAIPDIELRFIGEDGTDIVGSGVGELWVRGPNVMKGYYREPALTAAVMHEDGWLNTGDLVKREPDGALFIVGRTKEVIIRSGFNVYPVEVEAALNLYPQITQSAVVGRMVNDGNEEVIAFVEVDTCAELDLDNLREFLTSRLSPYKCPSEIIVMEALPAAATGKILKGKLKALAEESHKLAF